MTALSQRLFHAGADLLTFRTARRLRRPSGAVAHQKQTWRGLVRQFAKTKYGHDSGLDRKINYERFRTRVPLQAYEHAQPWIERMKRGEADVLWPGTCNYYAVSSGTATGRTRHLRGSLFGNVVLSRHPIHHHAQYDLSWKTCEPRGCQRVDISVGGDTLHLYNVHLGTEIGRAHV